MGVDVGLTCHVVVRQRLADGRTRALFIGEVRDFADLDGLMERYAVRCQRTTVSGCTRTSAPRHAGQRRATADQNLRSRSDRAGRRGDRA